MNARIKGELLKEWNVLSTLDQKGQWMKDVYELKS